MADKDNNSEMPKLEKVGVITTRRHCLARGSSIRQIINVAGGIPAFDDHRLGVLSIIAEAQAAHLRMIEMLAFQRVIAPSRGRAAESEE